MGYPEAEGSRRRAQRRHGLLQAKPESDLPVLDFGVLQGIGGVRTENSWRT